MGASQFLLAPSILLKLYTVYIGDRRYCGCQVVAMPASTRVNSGIGGKYKRDSHPPFLAVTSLRLIFRSSFSEPFIHFLSDEVFASICT